MNAIPTFVFYLREDSIYLKIGFFLKFFLFFALSIFSILNKDYLLSFLFSGVLLVFILLSGFFSYNKKPLLIFSGILFFSLFWVLFSKVEGKIIYLTFPWGTYISDNTLNLVLLASGRWLLVALAGLFFLIISTENELIDFMFRMGIKDRQIFSVAIAFNTVGFAIKDLDIISRALSSRNYPEKRMVSKLKKIFYIGEVILLLNLKRIESIYQSYMLRVREDSHAGHKDR